MENLAKSLTHGATGCNVQLRNRPLVVTELKTLGCTVMLQNVHFFAEMVNITQPDKYVQSILSFYGI
jgi:hypothetical protein